MHILYERCYNKSERVGAMKKRPGLTLIVFIIIIGVYFISNAMNEKSDVSSSKSDFVVDGGGETIRIVSGSENKELEPMLQSYAQDANITIEMDYQGSLDIMRLLESESISYDALWPASSMWLNMGDTHHQLKHVESTSTSPIGFGIKQSLAEELGLTNREDVTLQEMIQLIKQGKLKFAMTSATQSNSGASAYLGFLTAIAGKTKDVLNIEDLNDSDNQEAIQTLLSGVNRSSGSSNWLVDLYLNGDYDAMVNYETLLIQTNKKLEESGREPMYIIYPKDGLAISDSPIAFVGSKDAKTEETFLQLQDYILSEKGQDQIEQTGRRSAFGTVSKENRHIFKKEWGLDVDRVVSPITYPAPDVIMQALNQYQTQFKKPALTFYVLDYSGSMGGEGQDQLTHAMEQVLVPEFAKQNLLQGTPQDKTVIIPFSDDVFDVAMAEGNDDDMEALYQKIANLQTQSGTAMYAALDYTLQLIKDDYGNILDKYTPMIVILSDGMANDSEDLFINHYQSADLDIPIFSIMFASAQEDQLESLAKLSNGRVFDGRENMIKAFQTVKGYN